MDGETFSVQLSMAAHPNCRCTMLPVLPGLGDLTRLVGKDVLGEAAGGFTGDFDEPFLEAQVAQDIIREYGWASPGDGPDPGGLNIRMLESLGSTAAGSAEAAFKRLPGELQEGILGPSRYADYKGNLGRRLRDYTQWPTEDVGWGSVPKLKTLASQGIRRVGYKPKAGEHLGRFLAGERPFGDEMAAPWNVAGSFYSDDDNPAFKAVAGKYASHDRRAAAKDKLTKDLAAATDNEKTDLELALAADGPNGMHFPTDNSGGRYPFTLPKPWKDMDEDERLAVLQGPDGPQIRASAIEEIIDNWASTSSNDALAVALQRIAADEFGLDAEHLEEYIGGGDDRWDDASDIMYSREDYYRQVLRAMYEHTQEWLADETRFPGDTVDLGRGFGRTEEDAIRDGIYDIAIDGYEDVTLYTNPLTSWSSDLEIAKGFAGQGNRGETEHYVATATIPKSWVLSSCTTGFGCMTESEYVVLRAADAKAEVYKVDGSGSQDPNNHDFDPYLAGSSPESAECQKCGYPAGDHYSWVQEWAGYITSHYYDGVMKGFAPNEVEVCKVCSQDQSDHAD
jgi:hypothetical protein